MNFVNFWCICKFSVPFWNCPIWQKFCVICNKTKFVAPTEIHFSFSSKMETNKHPITPIPSASSDYTIFYSLTYNFSTTTFENKITCQAVYCSVYFTITVYFAANIRKHFYTGLKIMLRLIVNRKSESGEKILCKRKNTRGLSKLACWRKNWSSCHWDLIDALNPIMCNFSCRLCRVRRIDAVFYQLQYRFQINWTALECTVSNLFFFKHDDLGQKAWVKVNVKAE